MLSGLGTGGHFYCLCPTISGESRCARKLLQGSFHIGPQAAIPAACAQHLWRKPPPTEASAGFFSGWAVDGLSLLLLPMIGRQEHLLMGDNTRKALHTAQRGGNSTQISRKSTDLRVSGDCLWGIFHRNCRPQPNHLRSTPLHTEISAGFFSSWAACATHPRNHLQNQRQHPPIITDNNTNPAPACSSEQAGAGFLPVYMNFSESGTITLIFPPA